MAFEGVALDIVHDVAIFTSGLTGHIVLTKNLKDFSNYQDVDIFVKDLEKRAWFDKDMAKVIYNSAERALNKF